MRSPCRFSAQNLYIALLMVIIGVVAILTARLIAVGKESEAITALISLAMFFLAIYTKLDDRSRFSAQNLYMALLMVIVGVVAILTARFIAVGEESKAIIALISLAMFFLAIYTKLDDRRK